MDVLNKIDNKIEEIRGARAEQKAHRKELKKKAGMAGLQKHGTGTARYAKHRKNVNGLIKSIFYGEGAEKVENWVTAYLAQEKKLMKEIEGMTTSPGGSKPEFGKPQPVSKSFIGNLKRLTAVSKQFEDVLDKLYSEMDKGKPY